ncbi:MAG: T9SS type A sorting domain-containing protein [Fimbriimonadaceae bacterium]|nr:T9SS type A sorting domain-containing protein [Chitinophagales bacterium]
MKHFNFKVMAIGLLLLSSNILFSQIVGNAAFLKSTYVEMVVNSESGVFLTDETPPADYHFNSFYYGMVADGDKDGWDVGTPEYCGDYFAPGSPVEGFAIQIGSDVYVNEFQFDTDIPGELTNYHLAAANVASVWRGAVGETGLAVRQITNIHHGTTNIITRIILINKGDEPIYDIYYSRNVDPDQDVEWSGGGFGTNNIVIKNQPVDDWSLVTAEGLTYGCFLGLGSYSGSARVAYGGFSTTSLIPSDAWNGMGGHESSGEREGDEAMTLTFRVPVLNPGAIRSFIFVYGTNYDDLVDALDFTTDEEALKLDAADIIQEGLIPANKLDFMLSPNPSNGNVLLYANGIPEFANVNMEIYNMLGEKVHEQEIENTGKIINKYISINEKLQNGTYFIALKVNDEKITRTVILNR